MKVKDLIKELQNCQQDDVVLLTVGNDDGDLFCSSEFDLLGTTEKLGYIELYMGENVVQQA